MGGFRCALGIWKEQSRAAYSNLEEIERKKEKREIKCRELKPKMRLSRL